MTHEKLDLDALLVELGVIETPGGSASLREYTEDDVLGLLRTLQAIQGKPEAGSVLVLADTLQGFCADAEAGRRAVDGLPLPRIMDAIAWLQTADQPNFVVPDEPDGVLVLAGQERAVRLSTVGVFRRLVAAGQVDMSGDVAGAVMQNADMIAGMIDGMTPEAWHALPRRQSAAAERYINELLNAGGAPAPAPKAPRKTRRRTKP
jgi:hypothetical protein